MKARRSIISVPGNIEKMHLKAAASNADIIMLDLEDSVVINEKIKAREIIVKSINELNWNNKSVSFRINSCETHFAYEDLIFVAENAGDKIDSVVIPKVDTVADIHLISGLLDGIEKKKNVQKKILIEASIESAAGMMNIEQIAKSSDRLISLVFGIADYSSSIGAKNVSLSGHGENEELIYPGHRWNYALSRIVMAAKANDLLAIDAPYGNFKDTGGLKKSAVIARSLGMDGKWAIHPSQIDTINEIFSPDTEEIEFARKITEAHSKARSEGRGSVSVDGRMIDNATLRLANRTLEQVKFLKLGK